MRLAGCVVCLLTTMLLTAGQGSRVEQEHTKWIASVMDSIHMINPGMTRRDVLKVFTVEGGISNRRQRTYVYRECPYIKVTVRFEAIDYPQAIEESPTDKVVSVSDPFLQYSVAD